MSRDIVCDKSVNAAHTRYTSFIFSRPLNHYYAHSFHFSLNLAGGIRAHSVYDVALVKMKNSISRKKNKAFRFKKNNISNALGLLVFLCGFALWFQQPTATWKETRISCTVEYLKITFASFIAIVCRLHSTVMVKFSSCNCCDNFTIHAICCVKSSIHKHCA